VANNEPVNMPIDRKKLKDTPDLSFNLSGTFWGATVKQ